MHMMDEVDKNSGSFAPWFTSYVRCQKEVLIQDCNSPYYQKAAHSAWVSSSHPYLRETTVAPVLSIW